MTATSAPASYASIAARIPAQPAPTTRTSWVASTRAEASGTTRAAAPSHGFRPRRARAGRRRSRPAPRRRPRRGSCGQRDGRVAASSTGPVRIRSGMKLHARTCRCTSAAGRVVSTTAYSASNGCWYSASSCGVPVSPASSFANTCGRSSKAAASTFGMSVSSVSSGSNGIGFCASTLPVSNDRVHEMKREPKLGLAGPRSPGPGIRTAALREHRRMAVDDPEPRRVDRVLRDEPREAAAEADVSVVCREQRRQGALGRREQDVCVAGRSEQARWVLAGPAAPRSGPRPRARALSSPP